MKNKTKPEPTILTGININQNELLQHANYKPNLQRLFVNESNAIYAFEKYEGGRVSLYRIINDKATNRFSIFPRALDYGVVVLNGKNEQTCNLQFESIDHFIRFVQSLPKVYETAITVQRNMLNPIKYFPTGAPMSSRAISDYIRSIVSTK